MKLILTVLLFLTTCYCKAQESNKHSISDSIFTQCEIEPEFPGGQMAWKRFLNQRLGEVDGSGTVVVQFIVDKQGKLSDIHAISGPESGGLREEAIRVIRSSGRWVPGIADGRQVKAYKKVPILFN